MNGWNSQPAYSLHIYSAVISCELSHVLRAAPMQGSNSRFTHSDEMTASPTSETQKPQKIPPNVPTWQGNRNAVRHPATWEPSETSTRQTHRAWLNTGCVQTHSSAVCVFLGVLLKLILKLDSSCWLNHTVLTFDPSGGTFNKRCRSVETDAEGALVHFYYIYSDFLHT